MLRSAMATTTTAGRPRKPPVRIDRHGGDHLVRRQAVSHGLITNFLDLCCIRSHNSVILRCATVLPASRYSGRLAWNDYVAASTSGATITGANAGQSLPYGARPMTPCPRPCVGDDGRLNINRPVAN